MANAPVTVPFPTVPSPEGTVIADLSGMPRDRKIILQGAREHNLKNVGLEFPRDEMVVFTGLSGSGKSSVAFDTLFAEGQRRYVQSLSAYARQFLGQMDKPDVDFIEGLSPAVSIDQKTTNRNPRSTVGTITEIYDYLRLLFARVGEPHCPVCGEPVGSQTPQQMVDALLKYPQGTRFQVLAPVVDGKKGEFKELLASLAADGYARVLVDGETVRLPGDVHLKKQNKHSIAVVVDRLVVKPQARQRLTDSVETALRLSGGRMIADFIDLDADDPRRRQPFSENRACPNGHPYGAGEIEPRTFSFNAPYGACPACSGIGYKLEIDPELVVPDPDRTLREGAIEPWAQNKTAAEYYGHLLEGLAGELGFSLDTPWKDLPKKARDAILYGHDFRVDVSYRNRWGRLREYSTGFEGVVRTLQRRRKETESDSMREYYESYMRQVPCEACHGKRLKPEVLAVTVKGKSIADVCDMPVSKELEWASGLRLAGSARQIAGEVLKEIVARLRFLHDVGLDYLTLSRSAATLSGGEAQRIRLATQIGSGLVGVMYVLDEPSIGLHQRDNDRLIGTLQHLRDLGNSVIVVEHDEDMIRMADWVVDMGPGAGEHGGEVVAQGDPETVQRDPNSLTGQYLSGQRAIAIPQRRPVTDDLPWLTLTGATGNNLKNVDLRLPAGRLICVTGVSGSGKSTLVNDTLAVAVSRQLHHAQSEPAPYVAMQGLENFDKIISVDQSPIGRTPRSNPATYTGLFTPIRELFAGVPEARTRGYDPGRFSFNVKGGRCEACQGDGVVKVEMHFLPDMYVPCDVCHGKRYNRETLEIRYRGRNISEVLDLTVEQALEYFESVPAIARKLHTLIDVGLSYIRLGQSATTLSGGEAQRVKLSQELSRRSTGRTLYILDEPTTGLHFRDIELLLQVLNQLVDSGNTVLIIEHNLDVIKTADWLVDMGPEGGDGGGRVVAQGTPEDVAATPESHTGHYLGKLLRRTPGG